MKKEKIKNRSIFGLILGIFLVSFFINCSNNGNIKWNKIFHVINLSSTSEKEEDYVMGVHFLNVGQADCSYIKCGDANILIDSGDNEVFPTTVEYLNRRGVKRLDLLVATHPHRDHIGQMSNIIDNFEIGCFIMSRTQENAAVDIGTYDRMVTSLKKKEVNVRFAEPGDRIKICDLTIDILGPCKIYGNINDNSVVLKLTYGKNRFLFMGDAEKSAENDLIKSKRDVRAEVLKVGHHGSKTSTTAEFLKKVNPKYAVISSGPNKFGLPKREIIDRLNKLKIDVLRTDTFGDITFLTNGNELDILCERPAA